ncbi:MAG: hypothetical protein JKX70_02995 [Phycisphaerales bacterium]|nr:hypothetical protein [Phycisphaerales bacterium]
MKKNFDKLRSQMSEDRIARSSEPAQKMLDELLAENLGNGEPVPMDDVYWTDLRKRVADIVGVNISGHGSLKSDMFPGIKDQERQVAHDARN